MRFERRIKDLLEAIPSGRLKLTNDGEFVDLPVKSYKPDQVYTWGNTAWIVEIEASTSRKGFIGGYLKAQKYLQDNDLNGGLIFIIQQKSIKNLNAIKDQLFQYHAWLKDQGIAVMPTYLVHDTHLKELNKSGISFLTKEFLSKTTSIDT